MKYKDFIFKHKIKLSILLLIIISPLIYGFGGKIIQEKEVLDEKQGELIFSCIDYKDLENEKIIEWVEENHKTKGIHEYEGKDNQDRIFILSAGEQPLGDISINLDSVVGFKDKILLNGIVEPPKENIKQGPTYPYSILKIDVDKDIREVHLGTLNLYDVFRGIEIPEKRISVDSGIIEKIEENKIKLILFNESEKYPFYMLDDNILRNMRTKELEVGNIVDVKIEKDPSEYPIVRTIKRANNIIGNIIIDSIDAEERQIKVLVNNLMIKVKYREDIQEEIDEIEVGKSYLVNLLYDEKSIYISRIIGES